MKLKAWGSSHENEGWDDLKISLSTVAGEASGYTKVKWDIQKPGGPVMILLLQCIE